MAPRKVNIFSATWAVRCPPHGLPRGLAGFFFAALGALGPWGPLGLGDLWAPLGILGYPWALGTLGPWGPWALGSLGPWGHCALGTLGLGGP